MHVAVFAAVFVLACAVTWPCSALSASDASSPSATWSIREFYLGRDALRPAYLAHVTPHAVDVLPRVDGFVERQLVRLGVWLRLTATTRPTPAGDWCELPFIANATLHVNVSGNDGNVSRRLHMQCNQALSSVSAPLFGSLDQSFSSFAYTFTADAAPVLHLSAASEDAAGLPACVALPFALREVVVDRLADGHIVVGLQLYDKRQQRLCHTYFEAMRVTSFDEAAGGGVGRSGGSQYTTIVLLLVVIVVRFGPRYLLTRRGQLSTTSFRAGGRFRLLAQQQRRREELKQRTDALIAKLKAKDQAESAS